MRVVNDRGEAKRTPEIGPFVILGHIAFCAIGVSSLLLGPLPILYAHVRMTQPWPKIIALAGAMLALLVLEVPLVAVLGSFILGLFLADAATKQVPVLFALGTTLLIAILIAVAGVVGTAYVQHESVTQFWINGVDTLVLSLQSQFESGMRDLSTTIDWENLRGMMLYEGPFLYLSAVFVSLWISLGLAAHFQWWPKTHAFSSAGLRKVMLPKWLTFAFFLLFAGMIALPGPEGLLFRGFYRLVSCLFFMQGTIAVSRLMEWKGLRLTTRASIYMAFILLGFYLLVGMGVIAPWAFERIERKKRELANPIPKLEEVL